MGTSPPSRGQYRMIQGSQRRGGGQGWHQRHVHLFDLFPSAIARHLTTAFSFSFAPRGQAVPHQRGGGRGRGGSGGYPSTGRGGSNGYGTGRRGGFVGGRWVRCTAARFYLCSHICISSGLILSPVVPNHADKRHRKRS